MLHDVSALLARARSRDENHLRKVQSQAKGIYTCFACFVINSQNNPWLSGHFFTAGQMTHFSDLVPMNVTFCKITICG